MDRSMVAPCGLDCAVCDIYLAQTDHEVRRRMIRWFREHRGIEVREEDMRCDGCRGDRARHWSPDCWILKCCVDGRRLEYCSQCGDFACSRLQEWAARHEDYGRALARLKGMVEST